MTAQQLQTELANLGVTLPDPDPVNFPSYLRASIYLQELRDAQTFFRQTMAGTGQQGLGPNYSYVKKAVQDPKLLSQLAELLDFYTFPAYAAEFAAQNAGLTYLQYFNNFILGNQFDTNVAGFRARNAIVGAAIPLLAANFRNNILEMCTRVIQDRSALETLFEGDQEILSLTGLVGIKSTGSDFHKGGKQVLVLTFSKLHSFGDIPTFGKMQVIYKPSDLEVDCLITGDSAAVNKVTRGFMTASLVEMMNAAMPAASRANQNLKMVPLPTYKILPRSRFSAVNLGQNPAPVRDPYGYSEYLTYDHEPGRSVFNYYPFGSSDYVIFPRQKAAPIVEQFYRQVGEFLAMACVFSITDMHLENVRVVGYQPHLIDLELSLTQANSTVSTTGFFVRVVGVPGGGINGETLGNKDWDWGFFTTRQGYLAVDQIFQDNRYENRLYTTNGARQVVQPNANWLLAGLQAGITLLEWMQQNGGFGTWFQRLDRVLVRSLPYNTTFLSQIRSGIFFNTPQIQAGAQLQATVQGDLDTSLNNEGMGYVANPVPPPTFIALQHNPNVPQQDHCARDYENVDIPSYYHAIGASNIFDSAGWTIAPPPGGQNVFVLPNNTNVPINQATYYNNPPPTTNNVQIPQVQGLAGNGPQRFTAWRSQVLGFMRQDQTLNPADALIPLT